MEVYAEVYRQAVGVLIEHVRRTQAYQDFLVFPIVLCWRHHLELRLKALLVDLQELLGEPTELHRTHRITVLWDASRPLLERAFPHEPRADLDNAAALLGQLDALDQTSEGFRYPITATGKPSLPDVSRLHLRVLHESLEGVANLLSGASNLTLVALEYQARLRGGDARGVA